MQNSKYEMQEIFYMTAKVLMRMHSTCVRCVMDFNQIYEYPLLTLFTWNLFGIASVLITLQFLLVKYIFSYFIDTNVLFTFVSLVTNAILFHFKVG